MHKIIPVALGLLINDQGQFLITLRNDPKAKWAHLKWEIPGGGIEKGETPEQAVIRELKEEVGVEASLLNYPSVITKMIRPVKNGELLFIFSTFLCKIKSGDIKLDRREAIDYRWVTLSELKTLPYLSRTDEIVEQVLKLLTRDTISS